MALPGRDKTFAYENCRDLRLKLKREIDRLGVARAAGDVEDMKDAAFNACVTAWHLCDWVFNDLTQVQQAALNIHSLSELQAHALKCRALHLCRQVATASKHWDIRQHPDPDVAVIVTASPWPPPKPDPAMPPVYIMEDGWWIYFVDGADKRDASDVFEEALGFWTHFIYQNGVAPGDLKSESV
jgi:hypothetical protein